VINLMDADIELALTRFEDSFVERKTVSDLGDCLKTVVAFANSAPIGDPAIMFVGVRNNGEIEGSADLDKIQGTISNKIANAYPPIYYVTRVLEKQGKQYLAVIIPGSENRPHFAGQAYVRDGSRSITSNEDQFGRLIADRNGKAREILKWKGRQITLKSLDDRASFAGIVLHRGGSEQFTVIDCNQFYVTIDQRGVRDSIALEHIDLSFDGGRKCLRLEAHSY
jgi:predicted HTH transcriptional regulator